MRPAALLLLFAAIVGAIEYQNAQAPPPAPSNCEGWCPKWTCCKLCDDPACRGCGATRQCANEPAPSGAANQPASSDAVPAASTSATASTSSVTAPGFQTGADGKLRANGKEFVIKGINWWGTEGPTRVFGGLKQRSMDGLLDFIQEQGFNAIRILISHRSAMINGKIPAGEFDEGRTPELVNARYLDQIELMMRKAADRNLLVMINAHRTVPTAWPGDGLWYDSTVSEHDAINSWTVMARQLCTHWNFFAADLANEPRKGSWGRGRSTDWNKAAERIGDAVLQACPRLLIFVQGVAGEPGAPNDGGVAQGYFWGENLVRSLRAARRARAAPLPNACPFLRACTRLWHGAQYGVHTAPVRLRDQSKLVYSPHTYGPGTVRQQTYFPTCTGQGCHSDGFPGNMPDIWDRHFGFVAEQTKHAVVVGEFGGFYTSYDRQWQDAFVDYLKARGFGAFFFGLNPDSDDTGGLLHRDWRSEERDKLRLIRRMTGTPVASIIRDEPPSPEPPKPPPPPSPLPPGQPPPMFSDSLLDLFVETPPPPPPPPRRRAPSSYHSAPSYHSATHLSTTGRVPPPPMKAIILGGSSLVIGSGASSPQETQQAKKSNSVFSTTAWIGFAVVVGMLTVALRRGKLSGAQRKPVVVPSVRPRPRARPSSPVYDQVAVEDKAADCEDAPRPRSAPRHERAAPRPAQRTSKARVQNEPDEEAPRPRAQSRSATASSGRQSSARAAAEPPEFTPGMKVRVRGLRSASHYNGKEGVLISSSVKDNVKRWNLRLLSGDLLALKPENMEAFEKAPSMQAMIRALERAGEHDKAAMLRAVLPDGDSV